MKGSDSLGCVFGLIGGILGVALVILGAVFEVPHFCPRAGYVGTNFLGSFLYAIGNDLLAIGIVSVFWFVYLAIPFATVGAVLGILLRKRRDVP